MDNKHISETHNISQNVRFSSFKAKSGGSADTILKHCIDTMRISVELCKVNKYDDVIMSLCMISSLFHDIGKCINDFQTFIHGKSDTRKFSHNIISAKIFHEMVGIEYKNTDRRYKDVIVRSILYHHPVPFYESSNADYVGQSVVNDLKGARISGITEEDVKAIEYFVDSFIEIINSSESVLKLRRLECYDNTITDMTYFENHKQFNGGVNERGMCVDGVVRFADILSSSKETYNEYVDFSFSQNDVVIKKPDGYDSRFDIQLSTAKKCCKEHFSSICSITGFGKTMIGLLWMLFNNKKGIWVAPTNTIATSAYYSIKKELDALGISDKVNVGLLLTNNWVYGGEHADKNDIIVTNIDNFARPVFKCDTRKSMCFNNNYCSVVFDEYQSYATNSALMSMFMVSMRSRSLSKQTNTLIMSATPNKFLYGNRLTWESDGFNVTEVDCDYSNYGKKKYRFTFRGFDHSVDNGDCLVVRNSVSRIQQLYKMNQNDGILYHSKFTKQDSEVIYNEIIENHGHDGDMNTMVWATNIISTGVDVSFKKLVIGVMPMFEMLQQIGRGNRWGKEEICDVIIDDSDINNKSERMAIETKYNYQLCLMEYDFLKSRIKNGDVVTMNELYEIYNDLLNDSEYRKHFDDTMLSFMDQSFMNLSKLSYEYSHSSSDSNFELISTRPNLRTDNRSSRNNMGTDIFITVYGDMDVNSEYIQVTIKDEEIDAVEMYNFIKKCGLENKYYSTANEARKCSAYSKNYKHYQDLLSIYKDKARCSNTPFIVNYTSYTYDAITGLVKVRKNNKL